MFADSTRTVIETVIRADPGASASEKRWLLDTLAGPDSPVTVDRAAARLGVSKPTLFRKLREKEWRLQRIRVNKRVIKFRAEEVEELRQKLGRV